MRAFIAVRADTCATNRAEPYPPGICFPGGGANKASWQDAMSVVTMSADLTGVAVAMSAGNSGPGPATISNTMPWVLTVAAGTHDRAYAANITLQPPGGGAALAFTGEGFMNPAVNTTAVFYGTYCDEDTVLPPAQVAGKIVLCDLELASYAKYAAGNVKAAGGVAAILLPIAPVVDSLSMVRSVLSCVLHVCWSLSMQRCSMRPTRAWQPSTLVHHPCHRFMPYPPCM